MPLSVAEESLVERARSILVKVCDDERLFPGSPVSSKLVRLNLSHSERVRETAVRIAAAEGLDISTLELAAILHDVAKLDHRESSSGGIDTWHHHHRGASLARKIALCDLGLGVEAADTVARLIESHSDIPFIRRFWWNSYGAAPRKPDLPDEIALRDADVVDMIWVGGIAKIVHFRQIPGSCFYREDGGDIRKAVASARLSFLESVETLVTATAQAIARPRIQTVADFLEGIEGVETLEDFQQAYEAFTAPDRKSRQKVTPSARAR